MRIIRALTHGFKDLMRHRLMILLVFVINMVFGVLTVTPIKNILSNSLRNTHYPKELIINFDFTIWTDVIRENISGLQISGQLISILFVIYLLWNIFYTGGFIGLAIPKEQKSSSNTFWSSGSAYFFRFLRLTIYILLFVVLFLLIAFWYLGISDLHILEMESEMELIFKFKVATAFITMLIFLIGIFKDLAKLSIANNEHTLITKNILASLKSTFSLINISLGFVLFIISLLTILIFYFLSIVLGLNPILYSIAVLPQLLLLLLLRITFRYVRLSSFNYLNKSETVIS